ncbi:B9d1 [Carabus blaptoides fortunei]
MIAGPDWKVISGLESAVSQTANVVVNGDKIVFNLPIDITYKSTNPYGWPQFVISVYSATTLQGYGRVHVPFQPGLHSLNVPLSKPAPTTYLGYFASFFGYQPELVQASLLASGEGSHLIKMISNGHASLSMNVLIKGLQDMGYDVGSVNDTTRR